MCTQDINLEGTLVISCGMDHSLKIWRLDKPRIQNAIEESYKYCANKTNKWVFSLSLKQVISTFQYCNVLKLFEDSAYLKVTVKQDMFTAIKVR